MKLIMTFKVAHEVPPEDAKEMRSAGIEVVLKGYEKNEGELKREIAGTLGCEPEEVTEITVSFENWEDD